MTRRVHKNITIRGVTYADTAEAAAALGVKRSTVSTAIGKGVLDNVGTGQGRGEPPMPVHVRGKTYPSAKAAAKALRLTETSIYRAINQGREDTVGLPRRNANARKVPVTIGPLTFPSIREAERQLGFGRGYIDQAMRKHAPRASQRILAAVWDRVAKLEKAAAKERAAKADNVCPVVSVPCHPAGINKAASLTGGAGRAAYGRNAATGRLTPSREPHVALAAGVGAPIIEERGQA